MPEARKKTIRVLFSKVVLPQKVKPEKFKSLIADIFNSNESARTVQFDDAKHLLVPFDYNGGYYFSLAKERTGEWPAWLRNSGKVDEIKLPEGTLAETTCFGLHSSGKILAEAYSHFAPKSSNLRQYLVHIGRSFNLPLEGLSLEPIMKEDVYNEFINMNYHRKLLFKVANPSPEFWDEMSDKANFREVLNLLSESGGLTVEVTISVDRAKKRLKKSFVKSIVKPLFREDAPASKLRVWGSEEIDGPSYPIDLIHDRLIHYGEVKIIGHYVSVNDYIETIKEGFSANSAYLRQVARSEE